jgi:hypothetical protein
MRLSFGEKIDEMLAKRVRLVFVASLQTAYGPFSSVHLPALVTSGSARKPASQPRHAKSLRAGDPGLAAKRS